MTRMLLLVLLLIAGLGATASMRQPPQQPAQEGFVPVDQLPGQEQLPATPLVAGAYGVAWGAVFIYIWFLWRRLARVERELTVLARRIDAGTRR